MSISIAESGSSSLHSEHDTINNIVKLKLNKPKSWNWELSTSKSSPHICFPHIILYDDKNNLLAEASEANFVINGATGSNQPPNNNNTSRNLTFPNNDYHLNDVGKKLLKHSASKTSISSKENERARIINSTELIDCTVEDDEILPSAIFLRSDSELSGRSNSSKTSRKCKRSVSTNSCDVNEFLEEVVSDLKRQGIDCKVRRKNNSERTNSHHSNSIKIISGNNKNIVVDDAQASIKFDNSNRRTLQRQPSIVEQVGTENIGNGAVAGDSIEQERLPEIPILVYSERGLLQRDLNAKEFDNMRNREGNTYRRFPTCTANYNNRNEMKTRNLSNDRNINSIVEKAAPTKDRNKVSGTEKAATASSLEINRPKLNIQKSKSALEMPSVNMLNGQLNDKKKTRRIHSAKTATGDSTSYLERLSQFKRRSSSTDSQALEELNACSGDVNELNQPRYRLNSSLAGTLVVLEESFRQRKVRRRSRKCSNIYEDEESAIRPEKIVQKFTYNGNGVNSDEPRTPTTERHVFERGLSLKKEIVGATYNHSDKFASRYEKAIANIDSLISKVILSHADADNNKMEEKLNENLLATAMAAVESKSTVDAVDGADDDDNPMADVNNSNSIAIHHKSSAIHSEDNTLNANSISTLIKKNSNHQQDDEKQQQERRQQSHHTSSSADDHKNILYHHNGAVARHINEKDEIAKVAGNVNGSGDNNAYVKQKKFKRKINCIANNCIGNSATMGHTNTAGEDVAEKLQSVKKSLSWRNTRICRSASTDSQRFHLLSSSSSDESSSDDDDDTRHNGQINSVFRCDNKLANSRHNTRRIDENISTSCQNGKSFII